MVRDPTKAMTQLTEEQQCRPGFLALKLVSLRVSSFWLLRYRLTVYPPLPASVYSVFNPRSTNIIFISLQAAVNDLVQVSHTGLTLWQWVLIFPRLTFWPLPSWQYRDLKANIFPPITAGMALNIFAVRVTKLR